MQTVGRTVSTQDLSWLLEQNRRGQLDLDPPYQRRSVWTARDRRSFMDTIFKNYPSPPIFLHKTIDLDTGESTYHVVDGKQRISTVLLFLSNKVYLPRDFGNVRFDGKRWRDLADDDEARSRLWNYRVTVEEIDDVSPTFVREVFERLNKNSRKLTPQELRHARFDGWLITFLEQEVSQPVWGQFKIHTVGKERRMLDVQNLAELAMITVRGRVSGFDQDDIDAFFADLDEADGEESDFDVEDFKSRFFAARDWLGSLEAATTAVSTSAQPFLHFYTLWAYIAELGEELPDIAAFAERYSSFMQRVAETDALALEASDPEREETAAASEASGPVIRYKLASTGATTEEPQRVQRLDALREALNRG